MRLSFVFFLLEETKKKRKISNTDIKKRSLKENICSTGYIECNNLSHNTLLSPKIVYLRVNKVYGLGFQFIDTMKVS